jgi:hypothetical protein
MRSRSDIAEEKRQRSAGWAFSLATPVENARRAAKATTFVRSPMDPRANAPNPR